MASAGEHPALTEFRRGAYGGRSTAVELVRRGYVVVVIDMLYWGERRLVLASDPLSYKERPATMPKSEVDAFNRRASQNEQLLAPVCSLRAPVGRAPCFRTIFARWTTWRRGPRSIASESAASDYRWAAIAATCVRQAHSRIRDIYRKAGVPDRQSCLMYDSPHEFNPAMQEEAWKWLARWM